LQHPFVTGEPDELQPLNRAADKVRLQAQLDVASSIFLLVGPSSTFLT
jgi:hypothetical protein